MPSNIHNSPTTNRHAPKAGLRAFMGGFAITIAMVAGSAPAYAHCLRHIYNNSNDTWHMEIIGQPSNNVVNRDILPGSSSSYWLVTNGESKTVLLTQLGSRVSLFAQQSHRCYLDHSMTSRVSNPAYHNLVAAHNLLSWNEPADGDITICAGTC
jgi:hypothetical protein